MRSYNPQTHRENGIRATIGRADLKHNDPEAFARDEAAREARAKKARDDAFAIYERRQTARRMARGGRA